MDRIAMLPTPRTMTGGADVSAGKKRPSGHTGTTNLHGLISMIPTPATRDWKGASQKNPRDTVDSLVEVGATKGGTGARTGLKLQPAFVEWMMGFPEGWTELPDSKLLEMRLSRKSQKK